MKIVVFAGGVGTRLWPLSRKNTPKQFEKIIDENSTLQQTINRLTPAFNPNDIYIATGARYKETVMRQLPQIPQGNFIFEPAMRDVGPALGLVSMLLETKFSNEPIAILWSDHMVKNERLFREIIKVAGETISKGDADFVFITQKPRFANQNMGWIEIGEQTGEIPGATIYNFKKSYYRPSLEQAKHFFTDSHFKWNLGYFVTTPRFLSSLYKTYAPGIYSGMKKISDTWHTDRFEETLDSIYPTVEKISFDDAILIKLHPDNLQVISADLGWSDIGAWEALKEALSEKEEDNVTKGNVMLEDTKDTLAFNYTDQLVVGIDLSDMLVINTGDVLLVCPKDSVPKIKKLVESLAGTQHEHLT